MVLAPTGVCVRSVVGVLDSVAARVRSVVRVRMLEGVWEDDLVRVWLLLLLLLVEVLDLVLPAG